MGEQGSGSFCLSDAKGALFVYNLYQKIEFSICPGCRKEEVSKSIAALAAIARDGVLLADNDGGFELKKVQTCKVESIGNASSRIIAVKVYFRNVEIVELDASGMIDPAFTFPATARQDAAMRLVDLFFANKEKAFGLKLWQSMAKNLQEIADEAVPPKGISWLGDWMRRAGQWAAGYAAAAAQRLQENLESAQGLKAELKLRCEESVHAQWSVSEQTALLNYALSQKCINVTEDMSFLFFGWQFAEKNKATLLKSEGTEKIFKVRGDDFVTYTVKHKYGVFRLFEPRKAKKKARWEIGTLIAGEILHQCMERLAVQPQESIDEGAGIQASRTAPRKEAEEALAYLSGERMLPYAVRKTARLALEGGRLPSKDEVISKMGIVRRLLAKRGPLHSIHNAIAAKLISEQQGAGLNLRPA